MKPRSDTSSHYLKAEDLAAELVLSQQQGAPTVRLCEMFRIMAERFLLQKRYKDIPWHTKEDLQTSALIKCIKSIKNFKYDDYDIGPGRRSNCFSYFTRCIETSLWTQLGKIARKERQFAKYKQDMLTKLGSDARYYIEEAFERAQANYYED